MPAERKNKTQARLEIEKEILDEVKEVDYSSDVLAVGDESHFTIVNPNRKYTQGLSVGSTLRLYLSNPEVNGGEWTLKHVGIVVDRNADYSPQGSLLQITSADLGWHLLNCCAPLYYNLRKATYADLVDPQKKGSILDPSFGFAGVRFDNKINRRLKLGVAAVRAASQRVIDPIIAIQIEPGDTYYDKMAEYARRLNLLVNVSVDGYIQCFNPDYQEKPSYQIRCVSGSGAAHNNVIRSSMHESAKTIWTDIECVGEQVGYEGPQDPNDPNASKRRGSFYNRQALPFVHRLTFGDGEMYQRNLARKQAEWKYKRGLFDSFYVRYTVPEHHQNGLWWESDAMCDVEDEELGLSGVFMWRVFFVLAVELLEISPKSF